MKSEASHNLQNRETRNARQICSCIVRFTSRNAPAEIKIKLQLYQRHRLEAKFESQTVSRPSIKYDTVHWVKFFFDLNAVHHASILSIISSKLSTKQGES